MFQCHACEADWKPQVWLPVKASFFTCWFLYLFLLHLIHQHIQIKQLILTYSRVSDNYCSWWCFLIGTMFKVQRVFNIPWVQNILQPAVRQTNNNHHKVTTNCAEGSNKWNQQVNESFTCSRPAAAVTKGCSHILVLSSMSGAAQTHQPGLFEYWKKLAICQVYHFISPWPWKGTRG